MTPGTAALTATTIVGLLALWRWEVHRRRSAEAANARLLGKYLKAVLLARRWRGEVEDVRRDAASWGAFGAGLREAARKE
jgi:hypothetical protein